MTSPVAWPMPSLNVLVLTLAALSGISVLGALVAALDGGPLARGLARHRERIGRDCRYLRLNVGAREVLAAQATACALLLAAAVVSGSLLPLPVAAAVALGPSVWLGSRRLQRTSRIDAQLDGWLLLLASALETTPALGDALASSAGMVAPPIRDELELVLRERRVGASLGDALANMARRVDSRTVDAAFTALAVAQRSGGDLPRTLETAAASLREMARLEGVLRTKTAEGKAQALVIGTVPAPLVALLEWIEPSFLSPLFASLRGHLVLAAALSLWLVSIVWARRIVAVDL